MGTKRCINCMQEIDEDTANCPYCEFVQNIGEQSPFGIKPGTILKGRYLVGRILGQGGFGITYVGYDLTLDIKAAIKEYFPMGFASRNYTVSNQIQWSTSQFSMEQWKQGNESFLKEARRMAKLDSLTGIVRVRDTFLENQTSYIVMDYVEGETLKQKLLKNGIMGIHECLALLTPLMHSLGKMHEKGLVHRDISPDNIMIKPDGSACLLDFGAAKDVSMQQNAASQQVAKRGFSPPEQYRDKGSIGSWTDVYAFCATIYYCITGKMIPDAMDRMYEDTLTFDVSFKEQLSESEKKALKDGLAIRSENRIQSMEELIGCLSGAKKADTQQELAKSDNPVPAEPVKSDTVPVFQAPADETIKTPDASGEKPKKEKRKKEKTKKKMSRKKKIIIAAVAVLVFFYIIGSSSGTKSYGDYRYEIASNDDVKITKYKGKDEAIEIPSEINGKTVTEIGEEAFCQCRSLTKVTIPDSVKMIGQSAFLGCDLTEVTIPGSVKVIGSLAFNCCDNLTDVIISDGVTEIGGYAFANCSSLTKVTIPASVTVIKWNAFYDCTRLTEITIPDGVSKIEKETFANCTNLKVISLPAGCEFAAGAVDDDFEGRIIYRDASGYIKAMLDVACKNDSADFVAQNIGTAEEASAIYQEIMGDALSENLFDELDGLTDEQKARMKEAMLNLFAKADYTVEEAEKQEDGTYLVPVTYRQIKLFGIYMESIEQAAYALGEKYDIGSVSEEELNAEIMEIVVQCLVDSVESADYSDETAVKTVHVKMTEDGGFEADGTDIEELIMLFFDYDAIGGE